jgi:ubiquinone/menaquinone biosynthesis C-methylase UbiE
MEHGKFDTDSAALARRISAHEQFGSRDVNEWILAQLELAPGHLVLELGCGTGKQTIPIAKAIGEDGHIVAVDISDESVKTLSATAEAQGLRERISPLCTSLDEFNERMYSASFDRIVASYSLYYANDPRKVFSEVYRALRPGGILFFCGPSRANNQELKKFHGSLSNEVLPDTSAAVFMEDTGQQLASELFSSIKISAFENELNFASAYALYTYWSSYNLYCKAVDQRFGQAAKEHFRTHSFFRTTKRAIGVKAIK